MKNAFLFLFLITGLLNFAQIKGKITDDKGNSLPSVTIYEDNTYNGTTSNEQGFYELNTKKIGKHTIVFQFLGFKTQKLVLDELLFLKIL